MKVLTNFSVLFSLYIYSRVKVFAKLSFQYDSRSHLGQPGEDNFVFLDGAREAGEDLGAFVPEETQRDAFDLIRHRHDVEAVELCLTGGEGRQSEREMDAFNSTGGCAEVGMVNVW